MDELNPTVREQEIYEEMELTPEMVKSIRTLCGTCLRHFVDLCRPDGKADSARLPESAFPGFSGRTPDEAYPLSRSAP